MKHINEETPISVNSIGANNIQGINPEGPPIGGSFPVVRRTFAGSTVFDVDCTTFNKCARGKKPHERWKKFVDSDTELGKEIRDYSYKNPGKRIIVQDDRTGQMTYIKHEMHRTRPHVER